MGTTTFRCSVEVVVNNAWPLSQKPSVTTVYVHTENIAQHEDYSRTLSFPEQVRLVKDNAAHAASGIGHVIFISNVFVTKLDS